MYKTITVKDIGGNDQHHIIQDNGNNSYTSFPIQADNPHWIALKKQILADEAQLQDADGKTMTANKAKEFVATLP
jgi:hypothetical protein